MATLNTVVLLGHLVDDPTGSVFTNGTEFTEFRLAVNGRFRTRDGEDKTETCFIDIVVWGKPARPCYSCLKTGSRVIVQGRLVSEEWTDRASGKKRSRIRVRAENVEFLDKPRPRAQARVAAQTPANQTEE